MSTTLPPDDKRPSIPPEATQDAAWGTELNLPHEIRSGNLPLRSVFDRVFRQYFG